MKIWINRIWAKDEPEKTRNDKKPNKTRRMNEAKTLKGKKFNWFNWKGKVSSNLNL